MFLISSTANSIVYKMDALSICFPIISLKRFRLEEQLEVPQDESGVGSNILSKKHTLGNFICGSDWEMVA